MLNQDKEIQEKLQVILDKSHESIQAVWTDGSFSFNVYVPSKLNMTELNNFFSELKKLFPGLNKPNAMGAPTRNKETIIGWDDGYYAER